MKLAHPFRAALGIVFAGLLLTGTAACGGASDGNDSGPAITVKHSRGEATIHGTPTRIVAFGNQWMDAVQALGVTPVGYASSTAVLTGSLPPWSNLKDAKAISATGKVNEQVAALNPDLILVPSFGIDAPTYDQLTKIAPVIAPLTASQIDPWADQVTQLGRVLHREAEASKVIADVNGKVAAVAKELPGLKGKTYIFCWLVGPSQLMVLADPKDGASALFSGLGMTTPQWIVDEAKGVGRVQFSAERLGDLKSDLLITTYQPGGEDTYRKTPGFTTLPAVQKNSQIFADMVLTGAINEPTPLSVPYALDKLKPALANAAK